MHNILLITADQFRHDALGSAGVFPVPTPHLDALAAGGTAFDAAYCASPLCVPSRASIMTGRMPCEHGVYYNDQSWPEAMPTLPRRLADNGYYTACIGKRHFNPPRRHGGFHRVWSGEDVTLPRPPHPSATVMQWGDYADQAYVGEPTHLPPELYSTTLLANHACAELRRLAATRRMRAGGGEPVFLWLSFIQPHTPCVPPDPWFSLVDADAVPPPVRDDPRELDALPEPVRRWFDFWQRIGPEHARRFRAQYLGDVALVDHEVGRVLRTLDELGLRDDTLIVFTSDHGDYLGDHGLQQKGFFHEASARVPLVFYGPRVAAGRRVATPVSLIDLYPTLLDHAGLWLPRHRDVRGRRVYPGAEDVGGASLLAAMRPMADEGDEVVRGELEPDRVVTVESAIHGRHVMARQRHLKACRYENSGETQLFDLTTNPDEWADASLADVTRDLPTPLAGAINEVLRAQEPHAASSYYFKGRFRPMFT